MCTPGGNQAHQIPTPAMVRASRISRASPTKLATSARICRTDNGPCWVALPLVATIALPREVRGPVENRQGWFLSADNRSRSRPSGVRFLRFNRFNLPAVTRFGFGTAELTCKSAVAILIKNPFFKKRANERIIAKRSAPYWAALNILSLALVTPSETRD
jgi:hypothetical protein